MIEGCLEYCDRINQKPVQGLLEKNAVVRNANTMMGMRKR